MIKDPWTAFVGVFGLMSMLGISWKTLEKYGSRLTKCEAETKANKENHEKHEAQCKSTLKEKEASYKEEIKGIKSGMGAMKDEMKAEMKEGFSSLEKSLWGHAKRQEERDDKMYDSQNKTATDLANLRGELKGSGMLEE